MVRGLREHCRCQLVKFADERQIFAVFLEGTGTLQTFNAGACRGTAQSQNVDDVA